LTGDTSPTPPRSTPSEAAFEPEDELEPHPIKNKDKNNSYHKMIILSTSKGVMSNSQAKKIKIGGEILFKIL